MNVGTHTILLGAALLALAPPAAAAAQGSAADSAAIRAAALDYVEGWYEGNGDRMQRAVHPDLAKRIVVTDAQGKSRVQHMTAAQLVNAARSGGGRNTPPADQIKKVEILSIYRNVAMVKAEMSGWFDFMQLGRADGRWVIVNVLWEMKPPA